MSLNWSLKDCRNWRELNSEANWPVTNSVIWSSMALDLGEITEANVSEWAFRASLYQLCLGGFMSACVEHERMDVYLTEQDFRRRIGMRFNVTPLTRQQWVKKMFVDHKVKSNWGGSHFHKAVAATPAVDRISRMGRAFSHVEALEMDEALSMPIGEAEAEAYKDHIKMQAEELETASA